MALYASLTLLKASMKITAADRDELLTQALTAASRMVDSYTGRPVDGFTAAGSATARTFNPVGRITPDGWLLVDDIGSTTDLVVETGTTGAWTAITDYETGPDNAIAYGRPITSLARPTIGWPLVGAERVRITARWGWPSVPDQVVQATLIQALRLYRRKDSPEGVAGAGDFGVVRLARVDPDVAALLSAFVIPGFA
ncbi:MAG TPA: head-tail connector protein [Pilimelia sp.]|nr:head-tail connector protein [Pilimelia sp.]